MAENPVGPMSYEVRSCVPGDLSEAELAACAALVASGNAVDRNSAAAELPRAALLAIARVGEKIVGVGAIKRARTGYAARIAGRSGCAFDPATPELGYVAVDADHGHRGLSGRIVASLLSQHEGRLFATTDSAYMKASLGKAGFTQRGREWTGKRGRLSLWMKN